MKTDNQEDSEPSHEADDGGPPPRWLLVLYGAYALWAGAYLSLYWLGA